MLMQMNFFYIFFVFCKIFFLVIIASNQSKGHGKNWLVVQLKGMLYYDDFNEFQVKS